MIAALAAAAAALAVGGPPASPHSIAQAGDATARVSGSQVVLRNNQIVQRWGIDGARHVSTTELSDPATGQNWSVPDSPGFAVTVDSVPTSSNLGWRLIGATAQAIPPDPARPAAGRGVEVVFRYGLAGRRQLELDRTWSLYPGAAVEGVSSTLVDRTPAAFRIGKYSLAELTSPAPASAEVQAYHGGSDWRQDFRAATSEPGAFDDEGQIARFDNGSGAGWFLVGQRRGGSLSRVGRDPGGRTWVGVDNARDAFDWGPLMTSPPNYNRQDNPAYPAPVRQRTLLPLRTLDLGRAYLGVYHGGAQQAAAAFVNDFAAHEMPAGTQSVDLNSFHPWGHGSGLSDANLRPQAALLASLGGETFMLDDQWQGASSGDWQWDSARFPISGADGVPDFVKYLHSQGLQLGLWMSPAEFNSSSSTYQSHPQWACTPTGDVTAQIPNDAGLGVWDMNNKSLRAYLSSVID
ncbi:MAG TPA: alpha-galactosidase, partial [Solirubrobacteraceae bacterium]|nr:alpha-galactosidase [Solirubrobacteraceae bacterium]